MKGSTSLFAAVDLGSNAFRMTIGQRTLCNRRPPVRKVKRLREPVRLAGGLLDSGAVRR